ncbi:HDOD domain-containing protein [Methylococcus sp. EFPC2]|uniref:HDOD domain-containing protein n=1 Tax=Methylococcus sp. EFPC2 TaxID=2812648 RepID=UPI0019682286|nr:HDOD domain-containing protein [Methylococcus sp. EFPC2]QSA98022.1 HDOD domain-containing protein [Methylococcus sp. EFPC2]
MELNDLIRDTQQLVTLPEIYYRAQELLDDPRSDSKTIGVVIESDANLTARLLRIANSPLYSPSARVDRISYAITLLGRNVLRDLVLSTVVLRVFDKVSTNLVDLSTFWHHSLYCGLAARQFGKLSGLLHHERMLVAGLVHDIGQLLMYQRCPELSVQALSSAEPVDDGMFRAEREVFGYTHADVGARLLASWRLPDSLQEAVAFHHEPGAALNYRLEASLLHLGNFIANRLEPGRQLDVCEPRVDPRAWDYAGVAEESSEAVLNAANEHFLDVLDVLMPSRMFVH